MPEPDDGDDRSTARTVVRTSTAPDAEADLARDHLAAEAPLEIRVGRLPLAVLMRTPGDDIDLVRGFLHTEGIVHTPNEVAAVRHCDRIEPGHDPDNVVVVTLAHDAAFDPTRFRRNTYASSSCGICGKASIERALDTAPPLPPPAGPVTDPAAVAAAFAAMRRAQTLFERTGGTHAAALARTGGDLLCVREDVGRHNAVDKVIGATVARPGPTPAPTMLLVSGRISFEVVQKALAARIPVVTGISAATSLAADLAQRAGITLAGFARGDRLTVYTHPARIRALTAG